MFQELLSSQRGREQGEVLQRGWGARWAAQEGSREQGELVQRVREQGEMLKRVVEITVRYFKRG